MLNDAVANALSVILNGQKAGKENCEIRPSSRIVARILEMLRENGYLGSVESKDTVKGRCMKVNLLGTINKCGAIKPRHSVGKDGFEKFEKRYLPAKGFGLLIVSTPQGIMTHDEAKKKGLGGVLLAYCY
ncbi:30S ribosomal protein S8 [Candidatus Woesearchaeota archaeon]|nr:30S ribosomal protein S8 [Candidatus Woesearchaeota archaeon]